MLFKFKAQGIEIVLAASDGTELAVLKAADYEVECNINKLQATIEDLVANIKDELAAEEQRYEDEVEQTAYNS